METIEHIKLWLEETPDHTCFRVNKLRNFDENELKRILTAQSYELKSTQLPHYYFLKPDCLIIDRWPDNIIVNSGSHEVIVDPSCGAAVLRGSNVFAPGVMGLASDCKLDEVVKIFSDIDGKCKRGLKIEYTGRKQYVGCGYLKKLRCSLFDDGIQPSGIAVQTLFPASKLVVLNESCFPTGQVVLQNLPSIVCGWVVNPQPNEYILDMCASPGNKTTHLAEMSNNKAFITALDKTDKKVETIRKNCEIQGVSCVKAFMYNSIRCVSNEKHRNDGPPFPPNHFDKVLLDAPCSGLGQRPRLVQNDMSCKMLESYEILQRKLFNAAVNVLKVGGMLVYSTCTVTMGENEGLVKWALEKYPCLQLIPAAPLCGGPGLPDSGLSDSERLMVQRFGPNDDPLRPVDEIYKNSIGFFIAAFRKV